MSLLVVVLVFLVAPVRSWFISTTTDQIVPGVTKEMWLECRQTSAVHNVHRIKTVEKFVITKYKACGGKTSVADIDQNNDIRTFSPEAKFTVTGDILNDTSKFLRLTWSEVDVDDAGRYGCEVKGVDVLGNVLNIELKPKDIKVKEFTMADVKQLIKAIKDEYDVTHKRLQSEIEHNTRIQSEMEKKFNSEVANLTSLMNGCQCQPPTEPQTSPATTLPTTTPPVVTTTLPTTTPPVVTTTLPTTTPPVVTTTLPTTTPPVVTTTLPTTTPPVVTTTLPTTTPPVVTTTLPTTTPPVVTTNPTVKTTPNPDDQWPLGRYHMAGPKYPCPASHSSDVLDKQCLDSSNYRVVIASTNKTLCYCGLDVKKSSRATWPKGSYCIHGSYPCPTSFTWQNFDDPLFSYYYHCCRSDGSTSNEINLPTKTPFYLFTNKYNVCQRVKGMNVTQTYLAYDTIVGGKFKEAKRRVLKSPRLCHYKPVIETI